jgi:hypothetical protein
VMRLKWKLVLVRLEMVLILPQDGCTDCAERNIGSEIVLDAPNGTPRLSPFGERFSVSAR